MRAIIIDNKDARSLLASLELTAMHKDNILRADPTKPATVDDVHRAFHYVVVRWLQEQGADVTGR